MISTLSMLEYNRTYSSNIDSLLGKKDLHITDVYIPLDPNSHVLSLQKSLKPYYSNPLNSDNYLKNIVNKVVDSNSELNQAFFVEFLKLQNFQPFKLNDYDDFMANEMLNRYLGINLDSAVGFPESLIIKQYLVPILKASSSIEKDVLFTNQKEVKHLKKYADSLFFSSNIPSDNPYNLKEYNTISKNNANDFFAYSTLSQQTNIINVGASLYLHFLGLNQLTISNIKELGAQVKSKTIETNLGRIAIGGIGNDSYSGNYFLIIDLGGNDAYNLSGFNKDLALLTPVNVIVDFSGNDYYSGGDFTLGSSYFGVNLLLDYSGDDRYEGKNNTLGSSYFGLGILHDFQGKDSYSSGNFSLGASLFGLGILIDNSGDDNYSSSSFSQGFAFSGGVGLLLDKKGNDKYTSNANYQSEYSSIKSKLSFSQGASLGYYPISAGGTGILMDIEGNDTYKADSFSQGAAYFYGYACLIDKSGNDKYVSTSYSQGFGLEYGFGLIIDYLGNDEYLAKSLSQAYGSDYGFGGLFDKSGDDKYSNMSINQNFTSGNSISYFEDIMGNNSYASSPKSPIQSSSNPIEIFSNHADIINVTDTTKVSVKDLSLIADMNYHDRAEFKLLLPANISNKKSSDVASFVIPQSSDSLYVLASTNLSTYKNYAMSARDSLVNKGFDGLRVVLDNISTFELTEQRLNSYVLNKMLLDNIDGMKDLLLDSLNSKNFKNFKIFANLLIKHLPQESKPYLLLRLLDSDPLIRVSAIEALSKLNEKVVNDNFVEMLNDKNELVRSRAAYAIAQFKQQNYIKNLETCFIDSKSIVRHSAFRGIVEYLECNDEFINQLLSAEIPTKYKVLFINDIYLSEIKEKHYKTILPLIINQELEFRAEFYKKVIIDSKNKWFKKLNHFRKYETDLKLKQILNNEQ